MNIDAALVKKVAGLSRLSVDDAEAEKFAGQLLALRDRFDKLQDLDLSKVDPTFYAVDMTCRERVDESSGLSEEQNMARRNAILGQAPMAEEDYFMVPKVID